MRPIAAKPARRGFIDPRNIEVIDDLTAAQLRGMTPDRRLRVAAELNASAERVVAASVRFDRPDWSDSQVEDEVRRRLGRAPR